MIYRKIMMKMDKGIKFQILINFKNQFKFNQINKSLTLKIKTNNKKI